MTNKYKYFVANWKMFGDIKTLNSLNKVVKELDNAALDQKRKITIPFVRSILKDYLD